MLTLDLFNTRHEKELHEGAVDNTVARLIEPLSQRAADVRTHLRNGNLSPAEMKALEAEYKDLVQKRLDIIHGRNPAPQDECMGYGSLGETDDVPVGRMQPGTPEYAAARNRSVKYAGLPDVADKANKMSRLNQPGKVGSDIVSPQQRVNPNPNKGIIGHAKDWLTGKGGPGKEGPTYESELDEQAPPASVAQGVYNELLKAWTDEKDYLVVPFPDNQSATVTRGQIWNILVTLGQVAPNRRPKYIESKLNDFNTFMTWLSQIKRYKVPAKQKKNTQMDLGIQPQAVAPPSVAQPANNEPVSESQKKNSQEPDLSGNTARDPIVARELRKMRGRQPGAASDIEALVRDEMDQSARTEQQLAQQESEIDRQQQQLTQLVQANQTQSSEISSQGREIDNLYKQLDQAVGSLQAKSIPEPKVEPKTEPKAEPQVTEPAYMPPPVPAADPETQQKVQTINKQLDTAQTKLAQPGVSQSAHDALQKTVDGLRAQLAKLNKPATVGRAGDTAKNMGPAVKANQGELGFGPTPSLDDIIGQHKITDEPGITQAADDIIGQHKITDEPGITQAAKDVAKDVISQAKKKKEVAEGAMGELDAMRQDLELMSDPQFLRAHGMSKVAFQQKYRTLLKPALDEGQRLHQGDPIVVTAPNEFEGKTGEIYDFSPSGTFVIVNLYNHGKHSMHLSDVEYNEYADDQEQDDWYDDADEFGKPGSEFFPEGFQDFNKVEPYAVCLAGKPVKKFDYYEQARRFHDNWKQKLYREGNKAKADKITLMPLNLDEAGNPAQQAAIAIAMKKAGDKPKNENDDFDDGEWADDPEQHAVVKAQQPTRYPEAVLRAIERNPGMRADIIADYKRKQGVAETALNPKDPKGDYAAKRKALQDLGMNKDVDQQAVLQRRLDLDREAKAKGVNEVAPPGAKAERMVKHIKKSLSKDGKLSDKDKAIAYATTWKAHNAGKVEEAQTDYQKRRQRERDVDAGRPVKPLPRNPQTDYARKRAKDRKDMELGENIDNDENNAVEQAILRRIMVAHTDLLKQFGPEKVMQAAEEVAYNVGDVDEIGTSDVSAYVAQVKQILGVPEELDEKWSQKYKSSINCANPKGFSQRAHCAGRKK